MLKSFFHDPFLLRLIDSGKARNNDLQAALQRVKMAQAAVQYARANALPEINFNATAGLEHYSDYTMNGVGNYDTNLSPNIIAVSTFLTQRLIILSVSGVHGK